MDDEQDPSEDEKRPTLVRNALLTALAAVVVIGVVIALGTTLLVRSLGLDDTSQGTAGSAAPRPVQPLPSTALPVPGQSQAPSTSPSATPKRRANKIRLDVAPARASAMQRVDLTGRYRGADSAQLEVQRREGGAWSDFGVQATVRGGTFATYVMTGRAGVNQFRVFDPKTKDSSNVVMVTIG